MLRVLIIVLPIALAIYALVDLVQTEEDDVQGMPKIAWVGVIVVLGVVGPLAWILAGKKSRRILPRLLPPQPGTAGHGRPVAPDDDPDFLRGLRRSSPPRTPPAPPAPPAAPPTPPTPPVEPAADADLGPELEAFERELRGEDGADDRDEQGPDDPPLTSR